MTLTRGASSGLIDELKGHFHPVLLTYADHPDGALHMHTGLGDISWDSQTWLGAGSLVGFQYPAETGGLATSDATIAVAASVSDMLNEMGKIIRNRTIKVYFGTTTEAGGNVLSQTPTELFVGYFDSRAGTLARSGEDLDHDLVFGLGTGPSARSSASIAHGYEDQIAKHPGDTAGRHVQNADKNMANPQTWPE